MFSTLSFLDLRLAFCLFLLGDFNCLPYCSYDTGVIELCFSQVCKCLQKKCHSASELSVCFSTTRRAFGCSVRLRSSFLTNFALSLYSPWLKRCRYKPTSADNATDRNAPSIPNKQDAQPWGEQDPQFGCGLCKNRIGSGRIRPALSFFASKAVPLLA